MKEHFSLISFVAGFMLGVLLVGAYLMGDYSALSSISSRLVPLDTPLQATSTVSLSAQSGALSVTDQVAGGTVIVDSLTVPPPGVWVAVREMNGDDLGNVLGAVRVGGPRSDISVPLLRATDSGKRYAVELYRDDGNGQFDPSINSVYVDFDTGAPVVAYFSTNS